MGNSSTALKVSSYYYYEDYYQDGTADSQEFNQKRTATVFFNHYLGKDAFIFVCTVVD